jgi:hypothetical protein
MLRYLLLILAIWSSPSFAKRNRGFYLSYVNALNLHSSGAGNRVVYIYNLFATGVKAPGVFPYKTGMKLHWLITQAGGIKAYPGSEEGGVTSIEVLRPTKERPNPREGEAVYACHMILCFKDPTRDFPLEVSDLVIMHSVKERAAK